jgi:putative pyrroloquinoline-quinone binding quinoprotein
MKLFGCLAAVKMQLAWSIRALDVKNGQVVWDQAIGDRKDGFGLTGGPLVARGKVMVGTIGRAAGGNVIVALDAATGKEAWRFHVIARPGEPGGNSWNGLPLNARAGPMRRTSALTTVSCLCSKARAGSKKSLQLTLSRCWPPRRDRHLPADATPAAVAAIKRCAISFGCRQQTFNGPHRL